MEGNKAWVVAVTMGYGHQRAAYPLRHLSPNGKVLNANNYQGISDKDRRIWENGRVFYETFSRIKNFPLCGDLLFDIFIDRMQRIPAFYPRRDLSAPSLQLRSMYGAINAGWGKNLIEYLNTENIPLITTFPTVAFFAEEHGFKNEIYLNVCDADISRAWAPMRPKSSRIKYFAPCRRVVERLKLYTVKEENIFLTGFPLPVEDLGGSKLNILKKDLAERIVNLDPNRHYRKKYGGTVHQFLKGVKLTSKHRHPLTLTFAVGGAGAQQGLAKDILFSLRKKISRGEINFNLVAGTRNDSYQYFKKQIDKINLSKFLGRNLNIIFDLNIEDYFKNLNQVLRDTDILWTKPSEMVFYTALGLPIIMAPALGSQEIYNRRWLKTIGAGIAQSEPKYTNEWLFDWINSGWLAEAAMSGYLDGRQFGVYNIEDVVFNKVKDPQKSYALL